MAIKYLTTLFLACNVFFIRAALAATTGTPLDEMDDVGAMLACGVIGWAIVKLRGRTK